MTEADIQCLKDSIEKLVEIRTVDDECLVAKVLFVTDDEEYDDHAVLYEVISSNTIGSYHLLDSDTGYVLDFKKIVSVKPIPREH